MRMHVEYGGKANYEDMDVSVYGDIISAREKNGVSMKIERGGSRGTEQVVVARYWRRWRR